MNLEQELNFVRKLGSGLFCEKNWRVDQKDIYFFHTAVFKSEKLMFGKFFSKLAFFVQFFNDGLVLKFNVSIFIILIKSAISLSDNKMNS